MTITCFYTCAGCGLREQPCVVPARATEDVVTWLEQSRRLLSVDHRRRSPQCTATTMQQIKIPMTGTQKVGGPTVQ